MKSAPKIREYVARALERAAAGYQAQLDEKGSRDEQIIRVEQTTRVLDDVLRFIDSDK